MKYIIILLKYIVLITILIFLYPIIINTSLIYEKENIEAPPLDDVMGDIKIISLDKSINLYGQILEEGGDETPLPGITIEVENTDMSCTTGTDGDFLLRNIPIKNQKLNFYDANRKYIDSVEIFFNIDGGDFCLRSPKHMIIDVGNSDGKIFTNMQILFEINPEKRTLIYDADKIHGNVESPANRVLYTVICISFVVIFLTVILIIDRKHRHAVKA